MPSKTFLIPTIASFTYFLAFITCVVLCAQTLWKPENLGKGILVFKFEKISFARRRVSIPDGDGLASLSQQLKSLTNDMNVAIPPVASITQSAAGAVSTVISTTLGDAIPSNCSLGTGRYCTGFNNRLTCKDLPLKLSDLLPVSLLQSAKAKEQKILSLDQTLNILKGSFFSNFLIIGLVLSFIMGIIFITTVWDRPRSLTKYFRNLGSPLKSSLRVLLGIVISIIFLIPTVILYDILAKTQSLPFGIVRERGDVPGLCMGAFFCTVAMTLLVAVIPVIALTKNVNPI